MLISHNHSNNDILSLMDKSWILINPPILNKYDLHFEYYERPINIGLLHVSRYIISKGGNVKIFDLQYLNDEDILLEELKKLPHADIFGISNNFYLTQISSFVIAKQLRNFTNKPIIFGGSHIGEIRDINIPIKNSFVYSGSLPDCDNELPYNLWPKISNSFFPLETSQGCVYSCQYCHHPKFRLHEISFIKNYISKYVKNKSFLYVTYNFGQIKNHDEAILDLLVKENVSFKTQSRPDTIYNSGKNFLSKCKKAGLTNLSLGMETINPRALRIHKKTYDPIKWKEQTKQVVKWCKELGILVKLNIMLFNGDNYDTIENLKAFLFEISNDFNGVTAGPLMVFPGTPMSKLNLEIAEMSKETKSYFLRRYCYPVKIDKNINYEESLIIAKDLETLFDNKCNIGFKT